MYQFRPLLDNPKRYAKGLIDPALLLFRHGVARIDVADLAAKMQGRAGIQFRKNPASARAGERRGRSNPPQVLASEALSTGNLHFE